MNNASTSTPSQVTKNHSYINRYIAGKTEMGLADTTIKAYSSDLFALDARLTGRGINVLQVTSRDILNDIADVESHGAKASSIARVITSLRGFFGFLVAEGIIRRNPMTSVQRPKVRRGPDPSQLLTREEVLRILDAPNPFEPLGRRNRLILKILAVTGIKPTELIGLTMGQIDTEANEITLQRGKKTFKAGLRIDLSSEIDRFRREMKLHANSALLFPSNRGGRLTRQAIWHIIQGYAQKTGLRRKVTAQDLHRSNRRHF
jgi:integrase/recombinase XerD